MSAMNGPNDSGRINENAPQEEESAVRRFLRDTGEMFVGGFKAGAGLAIWLFAMIIKPFIPRSNDGENEKKDIDK